MRTSITYQIRRAGYMVLALGNAALAREVVRENPLSLLVLDPSTMTGDERALCQDIRANPLTEQLPVLLLVNNEREITQIEQMRLGVTDYLLKPLLWEELRACLQALMRGRGPGKLHRQARPPTRVQETCPLVKKGVLIIEDLSIDLAHRRVLRRNQEVDLTRPLLFDLLVYLAQHRGVVLTRTQLLAQVWGYTTPDELAGDTHTVSVHIHWLRQALEEDPEHPSLIQTVRRSGYRFLGEAFSDHVAERTAMLFETREEVSGIAARSFSDYSSF